MDKNELHKLSDEELLLEKKKLKKNKLIFSVYIGFLVGILIFGLVSWILSPEKRAGFLIPMMIPAIFIYRMLKSPNKNEDLEAVLKERNL